MGKITGVVERGQITIPEGAGPPEGAVVEIWWNEEQPGLAPPLEREPLTLEDAQQDIDWGLRRRIKRCS